MFGDVTTAGNEWIPRIIYFLQLLGILVMGFFSQKQYQIILPFFIGVLAYVAGQSFQQVAYLCFFVSAFFLGLTYGSKYQNVFVKIFYIYGISTCFIMIFQTIGVSPIFYLWDNSGWHDISEEANLKIFDRYKFYKELVNKNTFLNHKELSLMTQTRPSGLAYANNLACSLLLLGMTAFFLDEKKTFPKKTYLFSVPVILSGGLVTQMGTWLLLFNRFLDEKKQRKKCVYFLFCCVGLILVYQILFPANVETRYGSEKIVLSFTTRINNLVQAINNTNHSILSDQSLDLMQNSNLKLSIFLLVISGLFLLLGKIAVSVLPGKKILNTYFPILIYFCSLLAVPMQGNLGFYFFLGLLFALKCAKSN